MNNYILDTYPIIKELKEAGFDDKQAHASIATHAFSAITEYLKDETGRRDTATVRDVKQIEAELSLQMQKIPAETDLEIEKIHSSLELKIDKLRTELLEKIQDTHINIEKAKNTTLVWIFGMLVAQTTFVFTFC